jgi:hypothetical protein
MMSFRWKIAQAAEIRWWQSYLKNKPTTDYAVWKTKYWQDLLAEIGLATSITEGSKILDAGCGPAGIFMIFKNHAVDALDPLLDGYEAKLPHFKRENYPNVHFFRIKNLFTIPFFVSMPSTMLLICNRLLMFWWMPQNRVEHSLFQLMPTIMLF